MKAFLSIERLKMDEFGNISNWPENFFGNEMGDLFAMTEAANANVERERRVNERCYRRYERYRHCK